MNRPHIHLKPPPHSHAPFCADCPQRFQQNTLVTMSTLSQRAQQEANRFMELTIKLITRLNGIGNRELKAFMDELRRSPEICDHLSVYHADLLAQKLGKEMDAFYHSVLINTIEVISCSYTKWIEENFQEEEDQEY